MSRNKRQRSEKDTSETEEYSLSTTQEESEEYTNKEVIEWLKLNLPIYLDQAMEKFAEKVVDVMNVGHKAEIVITKKEQ
jgi:hypothetical protein